MPVSVSVEESAASVAQAEGLSVTVLSPECAIEGGGWSALIAAPGGARVALGIPMQG